MDRVRVVWCVSRPMHSKIGFAKPVKPAYRLYMSQPSGAGPSVAVVGAGVVGLSTAVNLQASLPHAHVTVIADRFTPNTTSDGAAGIFRPTVEKLPGVHPETLRRWMRVSWDHLHHLAHSPDAGQAGVSFISGYQFYDNEQDVKPLYNEVVYSTRPCTEKEMEMFPTKRYKYGVFWTTLLCECRRYLPYLTKRFRANGGRVICRRMSDLRELAGQYDMVVNCTGLGSQQLVNDSTLTPIRGQLFRVKAPWVKHFVYCGPDSYIIPGIDNVIVGGVKQVGDGTTQLREADSDGIWQRACYVLPSLKNAEVEWEWVGLRPHRHPIRIEEETLTCENGKTMKVVHCYGHGAEGVGMSWATACEATSLAVKALNTPFAKL